VHAERSMLVNAARTDTRNSDRRRIPPIVLVRGQPVIPASLARENVLASR
jgi:hypothetical protein